MLLASVEDLEPNPSKAQKSSDFQFKFVMTISNSFVQSISITVFNFIGIKMSDFPLLQFEMFLGPATLLGFNRKNSGETSDHLANNLLWPLILHSELCSPILSLQFIHSDNFTF